MKITKPMRACKVDDYEKLRFPLGATPKLDGIRSEFTDNLVKSKTMKLIPNKFIRRTMETSSLVGLDLDGELRTFNADGSARTFNEVQSDIMSQDGEPNFQYWVFDYMIDLKMPYMKRCEALGALALPPFCRKVLPVIVHNLDELDALVENWLSQGLEGAMVRALNSPYKCGQSTFKEQYLLKVKPVEDSECVVIGFEEQLENTNLKVLTEDGHSKRSSHKDGMVPAGTLGKFLVQEIGKTPWNGKTFAIGTGKGLDHEFRQKIWDNREEYLGKIITYEYQKIGTKDLPRQPIWKGFRHKDDLSDN
jgi:DNA ligase-1